MSFERSGRYQIVERIAAGGMGEVYLATMDALGGVAKPVALKLVRSSLARDPEFAALFVEEAKVAMSLSHANVVQAFDVGRIDDRWFLAMEHVDGVDLAGLLEACWTRLRQPMPRRHVVLVVVRVLEGLDYAHRRKGRDGKPLSIVHRDVSPGNVLVSFEGEVKVADFGVAKSALREIGSMAGTVKGKLPYMAPEQLRGEAVDRRADLYSVAAVLYEMLTRKRIVDDTMGPAAIKDVLAGRWTRPRAIDDTIPEALEHIVERGLANEPSDRYPNAAAMRQDLERFAVEEGYLLSSADLAEFVAEVCGERRRRQTTGSVAFAATEEVATEPAPSATPDRAAAKDAGFDALLGLELEAVRTDEPFSVFTTRSGRRLETARATPAKPAAAPEPQRARARERRRPFALYAMGAVVAVLAIVAIAFAASGRSGEEGTEEERAVVERGEPEEGREQVLPRGVETPETEAESESGTGTGTGTDTGTDTDTGTESGTGTGTGTVRRRARPAGPPGSLSANTDPWSNVYVDGSLVGPTPVVAHELSAGEHRVRFASPGGLERTVVVRIAAGEHRRVTLDLTP